MTVVTQPTANTMLSHLTQPLDPKFACETSFDVPGDASLTWSPGAQRRSYYLETLVRRSPR